jgi:hypothetical protein
VIKSSPVEPMMTSMIHFQIQVRKCVAELALNGIPLKRLDSRQQQFFSQVAHSFLINGGNRLELVVLPGSTPSTAREGALIKDAVGANARARLVRFKAGDFADDRGGETLVEVPWTGGGAAPTETYPKIVARHVEIATSFGEWSWQTSTRLSLAGDAREIREVIRELHAAFRDGRPDPIIRRARIFLEEEAKALPAWSVGQLTDGLRKGISKNAGRKDWVEDLDETKFDLRLCADDRLVECVDVNWLPILRTKPQASGDEYPFPLFLGKIKDEWLILR